MVLYKLNAVNNKMNIRFSWPHIVVVKKTFRYSNVFLTTTYAAIPSLGVFKPGAKHPVTPAPIKALPCLCIFPPMAEKSKPAALRVVGDPEHYYEKRYKSRGYSIFKVHIH